MMLGGSFEPSMDEPLLQIAQKTATPGEAPVHSVEMLYVVAIFTRK